MPAAPASPPPAPPTATPPAPPVVDGEVVCIGNMVADAIARTVTRFPEPGRLVLFDTLTLTTGGNGLNSAMDFARLGVRVCLMGRVGCDAFGDFLLAEARAAGVSVDCVRRDPDAGTSVTFVGVHPGGERSFTHTLGANARLCVADVDRGRLAKARALLISSFVTPALDGEGTVEVLRTARQAGVLTAWDAVANESADMRGLLERGALRWVDWCVPSELEARLLVPEAGDDPVAMAGALRAAGATGVCIKLAARGCLLVHPDGRTVHVPACGVDRVVDTTGAGDAWAAGFLTGLLRDMGAEEAARLGHRVAADCITSVGASAGIRPLGEVIATPRP